MSANLRDRIAEKLFRANRGYQRGANPGLSRWEHLADAAVSLMQEENKTLALEVAAHDALIDQGITRLQLLSFLRGEHSARWNGTDLQWVRYRGHQVDRECSPDATIIRLMYTSHHTGTDTATIEAVPGSDVDAATALRVIDTIIDAAIAHHGPDGVA